LEKQAEHPIVGAGLQQGAVLPARETFSGAAEKSSEFRLGEPQGNATRADFSGGKQADMPPQASLHDTIARVIGDNHVAGFAAPLRHALDDNLVGSAIVFHLLPVGRGDPLFERVSASVALRGSSRLVRVHRFGNRVIGCQPLAL
jgi:hypothetical protein